MKRVIQTSFLLSIFIFAFNFETSAQYDWKSDGNSISGSSDFIGGTSTSTQPLRIRNNSASYGLEFYTNNTLRFSINSDGNCNFGVSNSVAGTRTLAHGYTNYVGGENTGAFGMFNMISDTSIASFAFGRLNVVTGDYGIAMGLNNR